MGEARGNSEVRREVTLYNEGMRLIVVGVLVALASSAHADRIVDRCEPLAPRTLPVDGAKNVPLNAKIWQLGTKEGFFDYDVGSVTDRRTITVQSQPFDRNEDHPVVTYPLRDLQPSLLYWFHGTGTTISFETDSSIDTTPPDLPTVDEVQIELEYQPLERMPVARLRLASHVTADTALLQIAVTDRSGTQTVTTTPDHTDICRPGLRLTPGRVRVRVFALDLAGNRSASDDGQPFVVDVADPTAKDPQGHVGADLGNVSLILFGPVLLAAILLGILLVISLRHWRVQRGEGEPVSQLVADHIARAVFRRASSGSVAAAAGVVSAFVLHNSLLVIVVALIACVPLSAFIASRRVLRELGRDRARAELRETVLVVYSPNGQARLATSPRVIDKARAHAVPTSVAR
ncbi:MAG TPA: hypothetical protein VFV99_25515 [Kofleriaceae bacterium]|nr:hypothetical protein [Kofleriaceae bacterium]